MRHTKFLIPLLVSLILVPAYFASAITAKDLSFDKTPTPEQIKELNALPEGERNKIIQEVMKKSPTPYLLPVSSQTAGPVNCFDYYHFGSVQVDITPTLSSTVPGTPIFFKGVIKNDNEYPIVDGQVYVKIFFKDQKETSLILQNGYQLVDQFIVSDGVTLKEKENRPISFEWNVPQYAQNGNYEVAMYFTSSHRYNLLGLSFTDDITGNKAGFSVVSDAPKVSYFDKNNVKLNDKPFHFAAFVPHFTKDEKVMAYVTVINPNNKETTVAITWKLYAWDAILPEHLKDTKMELITLKPNEKRAISYEAKPIDSAVPYVVAELKDKDTKSVLDIRFVRDGIDETRINFPGILKYPLRKGEENTLFSCAHATNVSLAKDSLLTLTLKDMNNNVIHSYTYKGNITSNMMGFKDAFIPTDDLASFVLNAKLQREGEVVEDVDIIYDCGKIDPTQCPVSSSSNPKNNPSLYLYITVGIIGVASLGYMLLIRKKEEVVNNQI